jgi:lipoyl(octanoyl) transferase
LLLEHEPVITLGRSAAPGHVLADSSELLRRGISVHRSSRGGDVTYHGPGQLVGYPIVRLDRGVVGHLRAMADGLIEILSRFGIVARWRREAPGLWVRSRYGEPVESKICSFGVNVHRRVAIHGFALNVSVDLDAFRTIVPCGLPDAIMTSMDRIMADVSPPLRPLPSLSALACEVAATFARSFHRTFTRDDSPIVIDAAAAARAEPIPDTIARAIDE